ncbi:PP2C family protein-serine/threonine phosphatase [Actinomycetospora rhizophila]|uniref:PP2C family protein-serine/threonine phosphatase n=1 Tax=Actinomycetospora rhizophila TaxID=1416876 RepID=A0ABV9ZDN3_9PSEU
MTARPPSPREIVADLVDRVLDVPGSRAAPTAVAWLRTVLDADRVEVHLLDRRRERLHLAAAATRDPASRAVEHHLDVRENPVAQALRAEVVLTYRVGDEEVRHIPLEAHGHTHGVLTVAGPVGHGADDVTTVSFAPSDWRRLGRTLALLLRQAATTTDELELARRTYDYSIAAELQWDLLPPADVATDRIALRALVEPAPRVTSDLFDWSLNGDRLTVALLDAAGRGLVATQVGDLALAALRNARRSGLAIAEQAALADQALWDRHHGHAAVDALLLEIDLTGGTARAVHAGSPVVLRRRDHEVELLDLGAVHEPLGLLDRTRYDAGVVDLRPGDVMMLLSDGVAAARDPDGRVFGVDALAHRLAHTSVPRDLPSWLVGELRARAGGDLEDDATALVLEWHGQASRPEGSGRRDGV